MRFGVLGSLLVHDGDSPIEVRSPLQRAVLAALLVHVGQPVESSATAVSADPSTSGAADGG